MNSWRYRMVSVLLFVWLTPDARGADVPAPPAVAEKMGESLLFHLNALKKAPQSELREQARFELERRGVPMLDLVQILTLDQWLLDEDIELRFRTAAQLAEMKTPLRVLAIENLENLVAAERHPDLKWMHAVALSSIDPSRGSAIQIVNRTSDDAFLFRNLGLSGWTAIPRPGFENHRAISELTLTRAEYVEVTRRLRSGHLVRPTTPARVLSYLSPAATKVGDATPLPQADPQTPLIANPRAAPPILPPPPPQKIAAHPLIAGQRFEEILRLAEKGSEEAFQLLEDYGDSFPHEEMAQKYVPPALDWFWPDSDPEPALNVLSHAGPDAQLVVALVSAERNQFLNRSEERQASPEEILGRIESPGLYTQVMLKIWRRADTASIRMAVIEAMNRSPELKDIATETLRDSLLSQDPLMRKAALKLVTRRGIPNPVTQEWLEEQALTTTSLDRLADVSHALKSTLPAPEFLRKVLHRIEVEKSAEIRIGLVDLLLQQIRADSETAKKLSELKAALLNDYNIQLHKQLQSELRGFIQEANRIKTQINQDVLKQLEELRLVN